MIGRGVSFVGRAVRFLLERPPSPNYGLRRLPRGYEALGFLTTPDNNCDINV